VSVHAITLERHDLETSLLVCRQKFIKSTLRFSNKVTGKGHGQRNNKIKDLRQKNTVKIKTGKTNKG